jgi:hypothetical protein
MSPCKDWLDLGLESLVCGLFGVVSRDFVDRVLNDPRTTPNKIKDPRPNPKTNTQTQLFKSAGVSEASTLCTCSYTPLRRGAM